MNERINKNKMRILLATILTFLSLVGVTAKERMNVIFISVDDMNDWASPFGGNPQVKSPHMQKLADGGTTFMRAYTSSTVC